MSAVTGARVVRSGTAVELDGGGTTRLIRATELARQIGSIGYQDIVSVEVRDDGASLDVTLGSGATERFSLADDDVTPLVVRRANLMTCDGDPSDRLELIDDGALIIAGGRIRWRGRTDELAASGFDLDRADVIDAGGRLVTPGLIDCHTHLVFGGSRAGEFAMRARGAHYQEIAATGGGIAATRRMTLETSAADHVAAASRRLDHALAAGTTTLEAKSGYALTSDGELDLLRIAGALDSLHAVDVVPTLLGAHVVPPEMSERRGDYVALVCEAMIPAAAAESLCTSVDVYCDEGAFGLEETRTILTAARAHGLDARAHVGQFADLGGPQLLGDLGARSADHLEFISEEGIAALASHGVVAVMLPAACVQLRQEPPPVASLREAGVAMAVASDMNPGSSFCESLTVPMWLATTRFGMTVEETWLGVTRHAARALGRHDIGTLTVGARADVVIWSCTDPSEVPYRVGLVQVDAVLKGGRPAL